MKKHKPFLLTASIINYVIFSFLAVGSLLNIISMLMMIPYLYSYLIPILIGSILLFAISIIVIVFTSLVLPSISNAENYNKKRRGFNITNMVFTAFLALDCFVAMFLVNTVVRFMALYIAIFIIAFLALALSLSFLIVADNFAVKERNGETVFAQVKEKDERKQINTYEVNMTGQNYDGKKQICALTGNILSIVASAILAIFISILLIADIAILASLKYYFYNYQAMLTVAVILLIVYFVILAINIINIVFSAILIPTYNKSPLVYKRKAKIGLTNFIFLCICAVILLVGFIVGYIPVFNLYILNIFAFLMIVAAAALIMVDHVKTIKCLKNVDVNIAPTGVNSEITEPSKQIIKQNLPVAYTRTSMYYNNNTLAVEVDTFFKMKENGLIEEDEFKELKKFAIQKYISKKE